MKRLFIIVTMLAALAIQAQPRLNKGTESKAFPATALTEATLIGVHEGNNVWLNETRKGWRITALDNALTPVANAELKTNAEHLLAATMKGGSATLLLAERVKNQTTVYVAHLPLEGTPTVDTFATMTTTGRKDKIKLWGATSPTGNYLGYIAITEFYESKEYNAVAYLLDASGKEVHNYEYPMSTMEKMFVTDDGRIATLGYECDGSNIQFAVNYITSRKTESSSATILCNPIREIEIVNIVGNRMIVIGTFQGNGRKAEKTCGGVLSFAYDLEGGAIVGQTVRPFSSEDMNIFYNRKIKNNAKEIAAKNISCVGKLATTDGGVMAFSRSFEESKTGNDGVEHHKYTRIGLHVVAVDNEGKVKWITNIRRFDTQNDGSDRLSIGLVKGDNNEIHIYKSEHNNMPWRYNLEKPAKKLVAGKKSNLAYYVIDKDGNTEKYIIEQKTKHSVLLVTPNEEIITVRGKNKMRKATVEEVE